jgi:glutamate racemase
MGGLAVLRELQRLLPDEHVLYLGDTARRPYGPQPEASVSSYAVEITGFLISRGAKLVIIGCNTATVAGGTAAQRCFPHIAVLGMVEPGGKAAVRATRTGRIGVWGTALTVEQRAYDNVIRTVDPDAQVLGVACPDILRLAEQAQIEDRAHLTALARRCYGPIDSFGADVLILGCTDLTCVRDIAEAVVGAGVTVLDPAEEVVKEARATLASVDSLRSDSCGAPSYEFLITGDDEEEFATFAMGFLGVSDIDLKRVPIKSLRNEKLGVTSPCE